MRRALVVLLLCFPATAQAGRYDPYLELGRTLFPSVCWPINVETAPWSAEWESDNLGALAYPESCRIEVAHDFSRWPKQEKCETLIHEQGHLAGRQRHVNNPRSVMYWRYTGRASVCLRFKRRLPPGHLEG